MAAHNAKRVKAEVHAESISMRVDCACRGGAAAIERPAGAPGAIDGGSVGIRIALPLIVSLGAVTVDNTRH